MLVVASVSSIYGLGAPEHYGSMHAYLEQGRPCVRDELLRQLVDMLYERNDIDFHRGTFRVRGDVVEVFPQYEADRALRRVRVRLNSTGLLPDCQPGHFLSASLGSGKIRDPALRSRKPCNLLGLHLSPDRFSNLLLRHRNTAIPKTQSAM